MKNESNSIRLITTQLIAICLLLLTGMFMPVLANVEKAPHSEAELVSETDSIQPGQPFWVALRLKAEDHWHTYWQNAGDSGLATTIKWELPEGFTADPIAWPYPSKIVVESLVSYGFDGEVFLLVKITPPASLPTDKPVTLKATAKWLVCKEACIPGSAKLTLDLPVKNEAGKPGSWAQAFTDTRKKLPVTSADWKVSANVAADKVTLNLTAPAGFKQDLANLTFFPIAQNVFDYAAPQTVKKTDTGYTIEVKRVDGSTESLSKVEGVLVSEQGWGGDAAQKALKVDVTLAAEKGAATGVLTSPGGEKGPGKPEEKGLLLMLVFSFIGGLILNLMPCVLPVLSIKVLDFVKQANKENAKVWHHGMIFTLGVLVSFWILGGALMGLRAGGEKLGWGFQLQSPTFLIALCTLFFLFGLNLFGVFEVGTSLMNVGSKSSNQDGWFGSFSSGALATMVATPCTAPFMGSALGFAITQPIWASMLIFSAVGLGMAFPYILLSLSPRLLKFVPKPGVWMETFKQFMGFLLMATVVWLAWVLGQVAGVNSLAALMMGLVLMSLGAWVFGRWGNVMNTTRSRIIAQGLLVIFVTTGLAFAIKTANAEMALTGSNKDNGNLGTFGDQPWQPFSPELIAKLRAEGKPIFLDFTAAWCLSCKANEKYTLSSAEIQAQAKKLGIVPVKADWTKYDETITKTLESFGRSGVPLYVIYNPKEQQPVVLPEVITPAIVLGEFKKLESQVSQK